MKYYIINFHALANFLLAPENSLQPISTVGDKVSKWFAKYIFYYSIPVVPKLFWFADHLEKFGGPRRTKYWII